MRAITLMALITAIIMTSLAWAEQGVDAQVPHYSPDGDTAYFGNNAILRARGIEQAPPAPALLGTAPDGRIATVWGPEVRVTDQGSLASNPSAVAFGDSIFVSYSIHLDWGIAPFLKMSSDRGQTWGPPWCITNDDTASQAVFSGMGYHDGRIIVTGRTIWSDDHPYVNYDSKYSGDGGHLWSQPYFFLAPYWQPTVGRSGGLAVADTFLFAFEHGESWIGYRVDSLKTAASFDNGELWGPLRQAVHINNSNYEFWLGYSLVRIHLLYQYSPYYTEVYYSHSDDWGQTWTEPVLISDGIIDHSQWPGLFASSEGRLIATWFDYKYGAGPSGFTGDILYRVSEDNGETWGPELRLTQNHNATASQAFIEGNLVGVVWQDHRFGFNSPELYYAESPDLGQTWSEELRLTDAPGFRGYQRLYLNREDSDLFLFWSDARDNPPFGYEIYFRKAEVVVGIEEREKGELPDRISSSSYPNPFNSSTSITIWGLKGGTGKLNIYDICGGFIRTLEVRDGKASWDATDNARKKLGCGVYFARVETPQGKATIKLLLLK